MTSPDTDLIPVFDLDGTLLDSDEALVAPFLALGIARDDITFGLPLADECARLGVTVERYLEHYDSTSVQPFPGVIELVGALDRWAVCSNKHPAAGRVELARLGWTPEVAIFAGDTRTQKTLRPVLAELRVGGDEVVFVGDTGHDRTCAAEAGARFVLAAWNPRARRADDDLVARHPADVLAFC